MDSKWVNWFQKWPCGVEGKEQDLLYSLSKGCWFDLQRGVPNTTFNLASYCMKAGIAWSMRFFHWKYSGARVMVLLSPGAPGIAWTQQPASAALMPPSHCQVDNGEQSGPDHRPDLGTNDINMLKLFTLCKQWGSFFFFTLRKVHWG